MQSMKHVPPCARILRRPVDACERDPYAEHVVERRIEVYRRRAAEIQARFGRWGRVPMAVSLFAGETDEMLDLARDDAAWEDAPVRDGELAIA